MRKGQLALASMLTFAAMSGSSEWPLTAPRGTTPDSNKAPLIDWHDPEKIKKAKQKRAMRNAKRLKQRRIK